jgi:hypothetical protein
MQFDVHDNPENEIWKRIVQLLFETLFLMDENRGNMDQNLQYWRINGRKRKCLGCYSFGLPYPSKPGVKRACRIV